MARYPRMAPASQKLYGKTLPDVPRCLRDELNRCGLTKRVRPGHSIAVTAGSRGIRDIALIIREAVGFLRDLGAEPFIVPAMGSHGGATAEGQVELLRSLGVTEETVGAPIRSSMETVRIGQVGDMPVYMDRYAWESDGVLVINRVKPHTDFRSVHESGIVKMITIGLGKRDQAELVHARGTQGLREWIAPVAQVAVDTGKILAAVAILENAYLRTSRLVAVPPNLIHETDRKLLRTAKRHHPKLPFDEIDILVVDYLGKDISGAGLDTNVIGRLRIGNEPWSRRPRINTIVVLDVTDASHGNAVGIGLADIVTQRLIDRMDRHATLTNTVVSTFIERGFIPLVYPTDQEALEAAIYLNRNKPPEELRIVRIRSTLHLEHMWISEALAKALPEGVRLEGPLQEIQFSPDGRFAQGVPQ